MRTKIYTDRVYFREEGRKPSENVGYRSVEHLAGWVVWKWDDKSYAIPTDLIRSIETFEAEAHTTYR